MLDKIFSALRNSPRALAARLDHLDRVRGQAPAEGQDVARRIAAHEEVLLGRPGDGADLPGRLAALEHLILGQARA